MSDSTREEVVGELPLPSSRNCKLTNNGNEGKGEKKQRQFLLRMPPEDEAIILRADKDYVTAAEANIIREQLQKEQKT